MLSYSCKAHKFARWPYRSSRRGYGSASSRWLTRTTFSDASPATTRYLPWEPAKSLGEFRALHEERLRITDTNNFAFVVRRRDTLECVGLTSLENITSSSPELGIWLKESAHGLGYGVECISTVVAWAHADFGKDSFIYPVAVENVPSRRIAEKLHGEIIGSRTNPKYDSVVYQISWQK